MSLPDAYFDRFETAKYRSKHPLKRRLIRAFVAELHALIARSGPIERVLEIGVGEGFLSGYLSETRPELSFIGIDRNEADLARLREKFPRIDARVGDIYALEELVASADLVICAEVLEHLEHPGRALEQIAALGAQRAIFTVPHEPWFMLANLLSGKNLRRFGNDPEHINHFGPRSFAGLLEASFEVCEQRRAFPWLLALTKPR